MKSLPNGCAYGKMSVTPKNWESAGASLKKDWNIHYRFYDPSVKDNPKFKYGKLVIVKGMNRFKSLAERRQAVKELLAFEVKLLTEEGYNPITGKRLDPSTSTEIDPSTPLLKALEFAQSRKAMGETSTVTGMRMVMEQVKKACPQLRFDIIPVGMIKRKHIRLLLDHIGASKEHWSAHLYNFYRAYLSMLFKELEELEAVEYNPVNGIAKRKITVKFRDVLTKEERKLIKEKLGKRLPEFYRFIVIFYSSGGRIGEILRLKGQDVDLTNQVYRTLVKKGSNYREVERTIPNLVLPYWKAALKDCKPQQVIFSVGLKPGSQVIRPEQVTRRWKRHVKDGLGIDKDFYPLKHLNTDEIAEQLGINDAAAHNSHTTTTVTKKHYAFGEKERQHKRLKQVKNKFA